MLRDQDVSGTVRFRSEGVLGYRATLFPRTPGRPTPMAVPSPSGGDAATYEAVEGMWRGW